MQGISPFVKQDKLTILFLAKPNWKILVAYSVFWSPLLLHIVLLDNKCWSVERLENCLKVSVSNVWLSTILWSFSRNGIIKMPMCGKVYRISPLYRCLTRDIRAVQSLRPQRPLKCKSPSLDQFVVWTGNHGRPVRLVSGFRTYLFVILSRRSFIHLTNLSNVEFFEIIIFVNSK